MYLNCVSLSHVWCKIQRSGSLCIAAIDYRWKVSVLICCLFTAQPQHKSSFSQSTTNCKQPDGLITTATGGILRSRSPDTAAPPKPHRKKSLIETIKQWNVISGKYLIGKCVSSSFCILFCS